MIIVVSNKDLSNLHDDNGILVAKSLLDASKVQGVIDALVYHSSDESPSDFSANFAKLKDKGIGSLWYVVDSDSKDDLVEMHIIGNGGTYVDDEFFLEDSSMVRSLVTSDTGTALATLGGASVLNDFTNRYLADSGSNSSGIPKGYLKVVQSAVTQLTEEYRQKSQQVLVLSEKASNALEDASLGVKSIAEEKENLAGIIKELEDSISSLSVQQGSNRATGVSFFPRINFKKDKDIIRIKDIGRTPYLFSFMVGFTKYCSTILYKRAKLIVIEPLGGIYPEIYSTYPWITSATMGDASLYYNDIVFTNHPLEAVITKLMDDSSKDTFIILDRTALSKDHLLNSRATRPVHYALASSTYVESLKLKSGNPRLRFFTSVVPKEGSEFCIPYLDYPKNKIDRENLYLNTCSSMYSTLYQQKG